MLVRLITQFKTNKSKKQEGKEKLMSEMLVMMSGMLMMRRRMERSNNKKKGIEIKIGLKATQPSVINLFRTHIFS